MYPMKTARTAKGKTLFSESDQNHILEIVQKMLPKNSKTANHVIQKVVFLRFVDIGPDLQAASTFLSFDPVSPSFISDELFVS